MTTHPPDAMASFSAQRADAAAQQSEISEGTAIIRSLVGIGTNCHSFERPLYRRADVTSYESQSANSLRL
jgi:hypothetical protein